MQYYLLLYFLAGIAQDFLVTLNWRYVTEKKPFQAVLFSFLATVVSFTVLYDIFTKLDSERSMIAIITYAAGVGLGTFFGMKFRPGFKK